MYKRTLSLFLPAKPTAWPPWRDKPQLHKAVLFHRIAVFWLKISVINSRLAAREEIPPPSADENPSRPAAALSSVDEIPSGVPVVLSTVVEILRGVSDSFSTFVEALRGVSDILSTVVEDLRGVQFAIYMVADCFFCLTAGFSTLAGGFEFRCGGFFVAVDLVNPPQRKAPTGQHCIAQGFNPGITIAGKRQNI